MSQAQERPKSAMVLVSAVVRMGFFAVALFWPAGTLAWVEGWVVVTLFIVWAAALTIWLSRHDPALLAERSRSSPVQEGQKGWDKVLLVVFFLLGLSIIILPGLDAVRFEWSSLPWWVEALAMAGLLPCFWLIWRVMRENTFLSRVVKIDKERGHEVITTGPYAVVRHPMYSAVIPMLFLMPLALGSLFTLIPAGLMAIVMVVRTVLEDRMLHAELTGYPEYAARTRFRLVPGLW